MHSGEGRTTRPHRADSLRKTRMGSGLIQPTILLVLAALTSQAESSTELILEDQVDWPKYITATPVIYYNNENGTICGSGMTDRVGQVICTQFGWSRGVSDVYSVATGSREIRLLGPSCNGRETNVYNCPAFSWGNFTSSCSGSKAGRIKCYKPVDEGYKFNFSILQYIGLIITPIAIALSIGCRYYYMKKVRQRQAARGTVGVVPGQQYPGQAPLQAGSAPPPPPGTLSTAAPMSSFGTNGSEAVPPPPSYTSVMATSGTAYPTQKSAPISTIPNTYSNMSNYNTQFS